MDENVLFPFLVGDRSETDDWWSPLNTAQYEERITRRRWLSQHKVGRWLSYITMYDYIELKILQFWYKREPISETKKRVYRFFYNENDKHNIKIVPNDSDELPLE
jgi:hypothetical protein